MILVDRREGSVELAKYLKDCATGELEFGDAMMVGNGPDGTIGIGVERKLIGDLLNSIADGRLMGHQIPGMLDVYDRVYLVVEGLWRAGDDGELLLWRKGRWVSASWGRRWGLDAVWEFLAAVQEVGVATLRASSIGETCAIIEALHKWWSKPWGKHKSHLTMHKIAPRRTATLVCRKAGLVRRIAVELPHIGVDRALNVEAHFNNVRDMVNADEREWVKIEGIGKQTAREVVKALNGM